MHRSDWEVEELARNLNSILTDSRMKERLRTTSAQMTAQPGARKAALLLDRLLRM
jgi:UDP:flavonoid glycosyltransferase YjiC (YdhE family)